VTRKPQRPKTEDQRPRTGFAKKSLGQNFLVDGNYIEKVVASLSLNKEDTIIEIGPGRGALTERLVEKAGKVIAVEIDNNLAPFLKEKFLQNENFAMVHDDALQVDFAAIRDTQSQIPSSKLVANLPYYISTAILQRLIEQRECFSQMVLMLQREVVERITAEPANSERGFLTVLVEAYMQADKLFDVPPEAFHPAPKVWSAVARLVPRSEEEIGIADEKLFRELISAGFAYKRKTILNNLKNAPPKLKEKFGDAQKFLEERQIDPKRRAETLTCAEWKRLNDALAMN
jgi:16S rRNA (adenine1518-N6/adenine1519-N6)-dimethyltransferase